VIDEAINEIRRLFLATLLVAVVWFVGYFSARDKLATYKEVKEFYSWCILYDEVTKQLPWNVFDHDFNKTLESVWEEIGEQEAPNPGTPQLAPVPHEITVTWPTPKKYALRLIPIESILDSSTERLYRVESDPPELVSREWILLFEKRDDVQLGWVRTSLRIGGVDLSGTPRHIRGQFRDKEKPPHWERVSLELKALGFGGSWESLSISDEVFKALQTQVNPTTGVVTVFGVDLQFSTFLSTIGLLLAGLSFSVFGPILRLRSTSEPARTAAWIMATPVGHTTTRCALEVVLIFLSVAWTILPCFIAFLQISSPADLITASRWVILSSAAALVLSSVAWGMASLELYRLRCRS
jgi:hypothetical protein